MDRFQEVQAGFEQWTPFEKARQANRMRHQEAYEALERLLAERVKPLPAILDIGCGDVCDMARLLGRVPIESYTGLDNDPRHIEAAGRALRGISAPYRLIRDGYQAVFAMPEGAFDLIWMGLFLHHLPPAHMKEFFAKALGLLRPGGVVAAHDPVLFDGETRRDYLVRLSRFRDEHWNELTRQEKDMLEKHWSEHGHQQSMPQLADLAARAGFSRVETLWLDPDRFYAVLAFWR